MNGVFFAPGRTELAGNHTDHQKGRVLAASVDTGMTARVQPNRDGTVRVASQGFAPFEIDIFDLEPRRRERGTSAALCRGVLCALDELGAQLGGFDAEVSSTLRPGGGLSSSAAFEVLIGRIINGLYNGGTLSPEELARAGQEAENCHFGKPSGLMDQLACAVGGVIYMDFMTRELVRLDTGFERMGLTLCLLDTGGSHDGLTAAYAEIPEDMRSVARRFGCEVLGEVPPEEFLTRSCPAGQERRWARAKHFFGENERVPAMRDALAGGDAAAYLRLMNESGRSSETLLRNIRLPEGDDALARGLSLSAALLEGVGAWRVHGGGFAGCVQALMPTAFFPEYREKTEADFGQGACRPVHIGGMPAASR